jgi:hypothetical protein
MDKSEEETDAESGDHAARDRPPGDEHLRVHWKEAPEDRRQRELRGKPENGAHPSPEQAEPQPLAQVHCEAATRRRAHAAEHGDGRHLLLHINLHRARHTDRTQQQRNEPHQVQE